MKKRPVILLAFAASVLLAPSCGRESDKEAVSDSQAMLLYRDLRDIYSLYTDSLAQSADSALTDSIAMRLDDAVRRAYQRYPADLDMRIPQSHNDTLWGYVSRIAPLRTRFLHTQSPDSIPSDSIPEADPAEDTL